MSASARTAIIYFNREAKQALGVREEMTRPWFEHHITNAGTIEGWNKKNKMMGPAWERLKQEVDRSWELHNEENEQVTS